MNDDDLVPRNMAVGGRLAMAATTFIFFCPFFAYFYLRALDSAGLWRPAGVDPPDGFGLAIVVAFAASGAVLTLAALLPSARGWRALTACSLALGLAGVALQVIEYTQLDFGTGSGGFASVFFGWTAITAAVALFTMLWLETLLAYGLRHSRAPIEVVLPRLETLALYWGFVSGLSVLMWLVLYVL
jgi:heme/copper-type cytochrome/quinol oxidase subunit 3